MAGYPLSFYTTNSPLTGVVVPSASASIVYTGTPGNADATVSITPTLTVANNTIVHYINTASLGMGATVEFLPSKLEVEQYDELADNTTIETFGDNIVDFSQNNPFGEDNF
jgi:hypothetical protein